MKTVIVKEIDTDVVDGIDRRWVELSGTDYGTGYEFDRDTYAITGDDVILDCDGTPLADGDNQAIAVRNAIKP
jgi:hypothetical protein